MNERIGFSTIHFQLTLDAYCFGQRTENPDDFILLRFLLFFTALSPYDNAMSFHASHDSKGSATRRAMMINSLAYRL
eukprot:scaffold61260_cov63-Attheya_sp.AAC.1